MAPLGISGVTAPQPCYRRECAEPRTRCRKQYVDRVFRVADDRKSGQEIPDGAPISGPDPASAGHGGIEEHIGGIRRCGGGEDPNGDERVYLEDHAGILVLASMRVHAEGLGVPSIACQAKCTAGEVFLDISEVWIVFL
jgi:hypothetical protein